ncbi:MAG: glycosyltransferase family 2 protein [Acidobacteriota bacterium]
MRDNFPGSDYPLVSAVIPTCGRARLLMSAVRSALRQTWTNLEVIVIVDGPDRETEAALESVRDSRMRVIILPASCGGSEARNAGVRAARGNWIAFLDDDDEWLPEKIERQMHAAHAMPDWFPVVSCRLIAQSSSTSRVLPPRTYQPPQPIADYLFCRKGLRDPGGVLQTSTLLAPRDLLLAVPFHSGLALHQDWDWLIRVTSHTGVGVSMVRQPLAIWRVDEGRGSVGRDLSWKNSLAWIRSVRTLISPRAFAWFVAIQCAWRAQRSRAGLRARLLLLRAFLFEGRPELRSCFSFLVFAFVPKGIRQALRKDLRRNDGTPDGTPGLCLVINRRRTLPVLRKSSF